MTYLGHTVLNDLLARQIRLVADEQLVYTLRSISVNLLEPLLHVVEGVFRGTARKIRDDYKGDKCGHTIVSHVVNNNDTVSATVV